MYKKVLCFIGLAIFIAVTLVITLPGMGFSAGPQSLVAPAPPILDKIPPAWSQKLPATKRFELVLDGRGVLDKETGLVWRTRPNGYGNLAYASSQCTMLNIGGRAGWHLPTVEQLASLLDTSVDSPPMLPKGYPFLNVQWGPYEDYIVYLTASTHPDDPEALWTVNFATGEIGGDGKDQERYFWCVRGGQTYDAY